MFLRFRLLALQSGETMANKASKSASKDVKRAMHERKEGTLKSGRNGKTVTSKKQAVAFGLSQARRKGKRVPPENNGSHIEEMASEAWRNAGSMKYALGIGLAGAAIGFLSVWAVNQSGRRVSSRNLRGRQ